jgi:hypothetical protein
VLIVQSKYHGPDKHEKQEDFTHFCDVLSRLYDASAKPQKLNKKLSETLQDIDWKTDFFDRAFEATTEEFRERWSCRDRESCVGLVL